jgi:anthranilate/para-aminobenzoate synthase component II
MKGMGATDGEDCPFAFNFDPATFKVGDTVSYRVSTMDDWPFVGTLIEVHAEHVVISPGPAEPDARYKGTREARPMVDGAQV